MKKFKEILKENIEHIKRENERLKKELNITDKDIEKYKNEVAKKHNTKTKFLSFVGIGDYRIVGKISIMYNILDPIHKNYKSTVTYTFKGV